MSSEVPTLESPRRSSGLASSMSSATDTAHASNFLRHIIERDLGELLKLSERPTDAQPTQEEPDAFGPEPLPAMTSTER